MRNAPIGRRPVLASLAALGLGACAGVSQPSRFYTLAPIDEAGTGEAAAAPNAARRQLVIGIGPVNLADYLDRPQIITRDGATGIELHEFDKWAESLDTMVPRTMAANLAFLLGTDRVVLMPQPRSQRLDFQVELDIARFDCTPGDTMMLDSLWRLFGRDGDRLLKDGRARIQLPVAKEADFTSMVLIMSQGLEQLSRDLAEVIRTQPRT